MEEHPVQLLISRTLWQTITAHLDSYLPEEACGVLGGLPVRHGLLEVRTVLPVENELHSPVRFRMEPSAQLQAFQQIESRGEELIATFHSHPNGPDHPSMTDLAEFGYPGVLTLIFFCQGGRCQPGESQRWLARAFVIEGIYSKTAQFAEIAVMIKPEL